MPKPNHYIEFMARPGTTMSDAAAARLIDELRVVASTCFETLPDYQCLRGSRQELADKVLTIARRGDGTMAGFCSAVLLDVPGVGEVMHLGLTCVHPDDRGSGLTHKLTSRNLIQYLLRFRPLSRLWVSNVACVLSSLGNVALYFEDVYPSPFSSGVRTLAHLQIAETIDRTYRDKIYIAAAAEFDAEHSVFRRSVAGTVFQKSAHDDRYYHREPALNKFYRDLMQFDNGDEVLQVGHVSLLTGLKYKLGLGRRALLRDRAPSFDPMASPEAA